MRLIFATIVAVATLTTLATPVLADGERGRGHERAENREHHRGYVRGDRVDHRGSLDPAVGGPGPGPRYPHNYVDHRGSLDPAVGGPGPGVRYPSNRHPNHYVDNRGARYWGPSARHWSRWDNSWGDPHRYARQWGFDRYDHNRGWQRGNTWYTSPSQWSDWGGWSWSFSVGNSGYNNGYNQGNYYQQNANCSTYRTHDWVNGQRATVTYVGCADRWGQVFEQPGTRRVERWGW
jgi:hypothetical protein